MHFPFYCFPSLQFISGTNDEFLNRDFCALKGRELLQSTVDALNLPHALTHFIEDGMWGLTDIVVTVTSAPVCVCVCMCVRCLCVCLLRFIHLHRSRTH